MSAVLSDRTLLFDGAMGTELMRQVSGWDCLEELNVSAPEIVRSVHAAYRRAGADVLTTNTFGANRFRLEKYGLAGMVVAFNQAAVRLARSEARGRLVAGSIGPSGLRELPDVSMLREAFRAQAAALSTEGVDLFVCETFGNVGELRSAILGIREVSDGPIVAQMTYGADLRTPMGLTPEEVVAQMSELPVDAIGVNCSVGEDTTERVTELLHGLTSSSIVAQPNAGQPVMDRGAWRYPIGADAFGEVASRLAMTASHLGGCCGTTPEHIRAARIALDGRNV